MAKRAFARTIRANTTPRFFFQKVGPASFVRSHTPLGVCVGSTVVQGCPLGAVSSAGVLKSKNSFMSREGSFQKASRAVRSEEHTSELQSPDHLVCRLLLEKKKKNKK